MKKLLKILLFTLLLLYSSNGYCITNFVSKICGTDTNNCTDEDYNTITAWEDALDEATDITAATVKVFSVTRDGTSCADAEDVTGDTSGATGTVASQSTGNQILIYGISGTFQAETLSGSSGCDIDIADDGDGAALVVEVYDDDGAISGNTSISGFTFDADNDLTITAPVGERHDDGKIDSGAKLTYTTAGTYETPVLNIGVDFVTVEWLILHINAAHRGNSIIEDGASNLNDITIQNNIFYETGSGDQTHGINQASVSDGVYKWHVYNNIFYDFNDGAASSVYDKCMSFTNDYNAGANTENKINNNTCHNATEGIDFNSTFSSNSYATNNVVQSCGSGGCIGDTSIGSASTHNILEDDDGAWGATWATGTITSTSANKLIDSGATFVTNGVLVGSIVRDTTDGVNTHVTAVDSETQLSLNADIFTTTENYSVYKNMNLAVTFNDEANDDFKLGSEDTAAKDNCTDQGTDGNIDILGRDRDAENDDWDCGAHEFTTEASAIRRVIIISKEDNLQCYSELDNFLLSKGE